MKHVLEVSCLFLLLYCQTGGQVLVKKSAPSRSSAKSNGLAVPLPAIILLSGLGACLIICLLVYKFVNFDSCCNKEKPKDIDKSNYAELGQVDVPSEAEENTDFGSISASNPAHSDSDFYSKGHFKAKSVTSLSKAQLMQQRRPSAAAPRQNDKLSLAAIEQSHRVRSESDLSLGMSASQFRDRYSSWGDGLAKPVPPKLPISPLASGIQGRRAAGQRAMSAYGDIISLRTVTQRSDLMGRLQISVAYAPTAQRLEIEIIRVEQVNQIVFQMGLATDIAVHIALLPSKRARFKTKAKPIHNPSYQERWVVKNVSKQELEVMKMRFRLYSHEFIGKGRLLGETVADVMSFDLEDIGSTAWLNLSPSSEIQKQIQP